MKRLFHIFELCKNEQRVVLIVILTLVAIAFVSYERRIRRHPVETTFRAKSKPPATPGQTEDKQ
jgi:uncharacterized ion transporter superfamily protein YfcC